MGSSATIVFTACPFCATMRSDGLKDKESTIVVKDIAELVDEATLWRKLYFHTLYERNLIFLDK